MNVQVAEACRKLEDMSELQGGFNMVGFSQGGQFLRVSVCRTEMVVCVQDRHADKTGQCKVCSSLGSGSSEGNVLTWSASFREGSPCW